MSNECLANDVKAALKIQTVAFRLAIDLGSFLSMSQTHCLCNLGKMITWENNL